VKRILFFGICFFLTFISLKRVGNLCLESISAKHFCKVALSHSNKISSFVIDGILEWEDSVEEPKTQDQNSGVVYLALFSGFILPFTTTKGQLLVSEFRNHLKCRLFVWFENYRL
jgi:hypothetical protein